MRNGHARGEDRPSLLDERAELRDGLEIAERRPSQTASQTRKIGGQACQCEPGHLPSSSDAPDQSPLRRKGVVPGRSMHGAPEHPAARPSSTEHQGGCLSCRERCYHREPWSLWSTPKSTVPLTAESAKPTESSGPNSQLTAAAAQQTEQPAANPGWRRSRGTSGQSLPVP